MNACDGGEGGVSKTGNMEKPSPCWRAYGGHWLVLPQVELSSGEMEGTALLQLNHRGDRRRYT